MTTSAHPAAPSARGIPRLPEPDSTLRMLRDGYLFGSRGFEQTGTDAFRTRLLGRAVIVARGADAARFFATPDLFTRRGAVPRSARRLLQDDGSVPTLAGAAHRSRKSLLLRSAADPEVRARLAAAFAHAWRRGAAEVAGSPVSVLDVASLALTRAAFETFGIDEDAVGTRRGTAALQSMFEHAGSVGPPNWIARARRLRAERWAQRLIARARERSPDSSESASALDRIAVHREGGRLLPLEVAGVELLNLLRPTVAVSVFIGFAALALHSRPAWRRRIAAGEPRVAGAFASEIRRRFPFFPVLGGRATRDTEFHGAALPRGQWMLLDLYGTDHSPELWPDPDRFDPGRFLVAGSRAPAHPIVAQGVGDLRDAHRCPGEPLTEDLLTTALSLLAGGPAYTVPEQDLRVYLGRFPARPQDGMLVEFTMDRAEGR